MNEFYLVEQGLTPIDLLDFDTYHETLKTTISTKPRQTSGNRRPKSGGEHFAGNANVTGSKSARGS